MLLPLSRTQAPNILKPTPATASLVVLHNALVNARFRMSTLQMRLFMLLLSRTGKDDDTLATHNISVRELCPDTASKAVYADVNTMREGMLGFVMNVEELGPNGVRVPNPNLLGRPLMGVCDYLQGEGMIRAAFNVHMRPYVLDLKNGFFTKASLTHLLKLKSPFSHRIYLLLREFAAMGLARRVLGLDELRTILDMGDEYAGRFDRFRVRVLDRAREELAHTDLPFTYTTKTHMRAVSEIVFSFGAAAVLVAEESKQLAAAPDAPVAGAWQALLLGSGVSAKSLDAVQAGLDAGTYDEGYLRYVVQRVRAEVAAGRVKKEGGAVYKGITEGHYQTDYRKPAAKAAAPKPAGTGRVIPGPTAAARRKLESDLGDARVSLRFVLHEAPVSLYSAEQRQEAAARIEAQIADLTAKLAG